MNSLEDVSSTHQNKVLRTRIRNELGLNDTEFRLLVATPILTGSLSRIFLGIWTDQYGGRLVFTLVMIFAAIVTSHLLVQ